MGQHEPNLKQALNVFSKNTMPCTAGQKLFHQLKSDFHHKVAIPPLALLFTFYSTALNSNQWKIYILVYLIAFRTQRTAVNLEVIHPSENKVFGDLCFKQ